MCGLYSNIESRTFSLTRSHVFWFSPVSGDREDA